MSNVYPWPPVLSLPERFVGDPASLECDNIIGEWSIPNIVVKPCPFFSSMTPLIIPDRRTVLICSVPTHIVIKWPVRKCDFFRDSCTLILS